MAAELTAADYAILIVLKAEDREISNTELNQLYEVKLVSPAYERLNAEGLVSSETKRRPYRHVITDKGRKVLADPLKIEDDRPEGREKRTTREKQLWAAVVAQQKVILRAPARKSTPEEPADLPARIRAAYTKLADAPGEWVDLAALRPLLDDVSKSELDKALTRMLDARDVRLEPDPLEHRVSAETRNAAVHIGGEDRHKLAIGRR